MARTTAVWAAVAATLLAPSALASVGYEGEVFDPTDPADYVRLGFDAPGYLDVTIPSAPNPVTLAVDAADELGLVLGSTDTDGYRLQTGGPVPVPALPVLWFPGLMDEHAVYPEYLLAFEEDTGAVLASAENLRHDTRGRLGRDLERPEWERFPRALLNLDAFDLRVGATLEPDTGASTAAAPSAPSAPAAARALGTGGAALLERDAPSPLLGPATLLPATVPGASTGGSAAPAPLAPAAVAPAATLAADAAVALGAAAAGLLLGAFALYHLVNRNNIFENDVRMQVYDIVARNPGITIQEVARQVRLSHPTARYHLNVLAKNDLVVFLDKGNKMMFFRNRNEFTEQERELVALLRNAEAMRVYECIEQSPWILRKELSERLGISRTSVNWHLRNLMRAGLLAETREQGKGFLFVRREGRELLIRVSQRVGVPPLASAPAPAPAPVPEPAETGSVAPVPLALGNGHQQAA